MVKDKFVIYLEIFQTIPEYNYQAVENNRQKKPCKVNWYF